MSVDCLCDWRAVRVAESLLTQFLRSSETAHEGGVRVTEGIEAIAPRHLYIDQNRAGRSGKLRWMSRRPGCMRLLRGRSPLSVLIDAQPPNLRFQRLPGNPEFRGRAGRPGDPPVAFGESRFDHLDLTIC
jgi:hypothetical protein